MISVNIKINLFLNTSNKQLDNEILEDSIFTSTKYLKYMVINVMTDVQGFYMDKY